jgi:hypothetical protein
MQPESGEVVQADEGDRDERQAWNPMAQLTACPPGTPYTSRPTFAAASNTPKNPGDDGSATPMAIMP